MLPPSRRRGTWLQLGLLALSLIGLAVLRLTILQPALAEDRQTMDKLAIEKVLKDQDDAWNRGDLEGFMKGYWNSADLTFYSGDTPRKGYDETFKRYRKRYQDHEQEPMTYPEMVAVMMARYRQQNPAPDREMGKLTFSDLNIELLGPDSAFVRGRWQLMISRGKIGGLFTLIMKRFPEGWRIIHDHTS
jgi:beta-aspartyl-peptidase (threonine type)